MQKYILSVIVQNNAGVLARVSSLFGRRGYNIDSLTVSATADPAISRITIVTSGDAATLDQVFKQVSKLEETISIEHMKEEKAYCRELVFIKIQTDSPETREQMREIAQVYGAHIVVSEETYMLVELTEIPSRVDSFMDVISNFKVLETCRSGVTAMTR